MALIEKWIAPTTETPNSKFNINSISNDTLFWIVLAIIGKKDPKAVERIILKMYDVTGDALRAYCHAGMANPVSAWGAGQLLSLFMERHGFITQSQALNFQIGQTIIAGVDLTVNAADIFAKLPIVSWFVGPGQVKPSEFPDSVSIVDNVLPTLAKSIIPAVIP